MPRICDRAGLKSYIEYLTANATTEAAQSTNRRDAMHARGRIHAYGLVLGVIREWEDSDRESVTAIVPVPGQESPT